MKKLSLLCLAIVLFMSSTLHGQVNNATVYKLFSPDKNLELNFYLNASGTPLYELKYKQKTVLEPSTLGFDVKENLSDRIIPSLRNNWQLTDQREQTFNESWNPVWGEVKTIQNQYQELFVQLTQNNPNAIKINIIFRLFNDGLGFRYEFPQQRNLHHFTIVNEYSEFNLTNDHKAFWIPGDFDSNEFNPKTTTLSKVDASISQSYSSINTKAYLSNNLVQTPLMLKTTDSLYINIHEAALVNYPAMQLLIDKDKFCLTSTLAPDYTGNKAYLQTPAKTPWRTVIVSDKATDILASKLILNLNDPSVIADPSWIKPSKFVGVWWEMHVNKSTWNKSSGKHGANTENVKRYIDFAAKNNLSSVLVEGWNIGWEDWYGQWKENVFDFITPYSDFDVKALQQYAASKNVKLIMHHETSGSVSNYERHMDTAYRFMKENGYDAVKTGYVGRIIPRGEHHDGQWMVNHYNRVAQKTAQYKIMLDAHEPVRPTGLHRTYPNWMACEAARGNEFNAWSEGNLPEHETILPFTRLVGGPMDYTPGILETDLTYGDTTRKKFVIHTTLVKQLALYVTMYSPLQMAADLPENYERYADAFQFIKDVAVDWDDTRYLEAEPGDYITVARKEKQSDNWFIGAITDEQKRSSTIALNFLDPNKKYEAINYTDGATADWEKNPKAYVISKKTVTQKSMLKLQLAAGGGCAISIKPIQ
ncbi:MAG: glycoside hydrolase family 97 protein [Ferruginibacter sp.]